MTLSLSSLSPLHLLAPLALALAGASPHARADSFAVDVRPWTNVLGRDGNFYGAALEGGRAGGFVYSYTPAGRLQYRHLFTQAPPISPQGSDPESLVSIGEDGAIYGSTAQGGVFGRGLLYKIDRRGVFTNLYHFDQPTGSTGPILTTRTGDVYATFPTSQSALHLAKDGSHAWISLPGYPTVLTESATGDVILGTRFYQSNPGGARPSSGALWRLNSSGQFEAFSDVGYFPTSLVPLPDGSLLCLSGDQVLQISTAGDVSTIHQFSAPAEGLDPDFLVVAQDGSYLGSTSAGGLNNGGTVFRIVPDTQSYTVLSSLPAPTLNGGGAPWLKHVLPLRAAAQDGNHPPVAQDDLVPAAALKPLPHTPGALPQLVIPVLTNDSDADRDPLTIVSVGAPSSGTVAFDFVSQKITYTAGSAQVANDNFPYTIVDGSGGTAVGTVVIRAKTAGHYVGAVSTPPDAASGDPGTVVGSLALSLSESRVLSGGLTLLGQTYRLAGRFNDANQFAAVLESHPSLDSYTGLQLWLRPNGASWTIEATIQKNYVPYSASCTIPPQS